MFTSTFLRKNPLTRQTRHTFNRSRANLNGPIRNTFIVFCWNQSETILLQGSQSSCFLSSTCAEELWVEIVLRVEQQLAIWDTLYVSIMNRFSCYLYLIYYLIWEQDGFVFLAFAEILQVPLRVLSGSMWHNLSLVSVIFIFYVAFLYRGGRRAFNIPC